MCTRMHCAGGSTQVRWPEVAYPSPWRHSHTNPDILLSTMDYDEDRTPGDSGDTPRWNEDRNLADGSLHAVSVVDVLSWQCDKESTNFVLIERRAEGNPCRDPLGQPAGKVQSQTTNAQTDHFFSPPSIEYSA